nr:hypothetical protein Itr_chr06CG11400 [Ipomoea trifida]
MANQNGLPQAGRQPLDFVRVELLLANKRKRSNALVAKHPEAILASMTMIFLHNVIWRLSPLDCCKGESRPGSPCCWFISLCSTSCKAANLDWVPTLACASSKVPGVFGRLTLG